MLCVTGAAFYQLYTQRMDEERGVGLQLARLASQSMALWLDNQVSLVQTMAQSPALREASAKPQSPALRLAASDLLRAFHTHHPSYTLMALISFEVPPEGITVRNDKGKDVLVHKGHSLGDSRGNVSVGIGGFDFSYIDAIYKGAPGFISEAKVNSVPGLPPVFVLAAPVYGPSGARAGVLIASITLGNFSQNFSKGSSLSGMANMEIVDQRGRYVAHDQTERVLNAKNPPLPSLLLALQEKKDHFSVENEEGLTQLYSASEVAPRHPSADRWWVLFRRDLGDVLAELHAPLFSLGLLFFLLFVLVAYLMRKMGLHMRQIVSDSAMQAELTMQLKIKQTLQKERGTLRSIIDNIQGIVFLRDEEARYVIVNSQFTIMLGMTQEFVEGKTDDDLLPPEMATFCRSTDDAAKARRGPYYFEQNLPAPDGTQRDYLFSKEVLRGEEGTFRGMLGVGFDVTLLKQTQRELTVAKGKAEEASRAKSVFLSTMSHEIRTPMNAIVGFAHLFGRTALNDAQKEYLKKIHAASASLLSIINSVLDLSKIESGKLELEHIPFRLDTLLRTVVSMAEHNAQPKGISFTLVVDTRTPRHFMGDPTRVQQVLVNMVNNAVKFTDVGGVRLDVTVARDEDTTDASTGRRECSWDQGLARDEAHAAATPPQPWPVRTRISFCISDSGIGMDSEQQRRIFEPFTQADASTTRKYGGTGLGLSICRELVELMGGSIALRSEQGQGSTFSIVLPLEECAPPEEHVSDEHESDDNAAPQHPNPQASNAAPPFAGFDVLLVEDNAINQEIANALLENLGIDVDTADDGQHALDKVRQHRYDLIFMDIQMPNMDGLECTRRLRRKGALAQQALETPPTPDTMDTQARPEDLWLSAVPIIAMTANAMQEDKANCLAAGMNGHLGKPLDPAALRDMLRRWLT